MGCEAEAFAGNDRKTSVILCNVFRTQEKRAYYHTWHDLPFWHTGVRVSCGSRPMEATSEGGLHHHQHA